MFLLLIIRTQKVAFISWTQGSNTASGSMHLCPLCFSPSLEHSSSLAFCLYLLSLWFCSIVLFPFALKYRHLRTAFTPDSSVPCIFVDISGCGFHIPGAYPPHPLPHRADTKVMFFIVVEVFRLERVRFEPRPLFHVEVVVLDAIAHNLAKVAS